MTGAVERILVADDEMGMREGCRRVLAAEGFDVVVAADGFEALEIFKREGGFAAALVDLKMPRMGGIELIQEIRRLDGDVLILVVTAYATIETAVEATKLGAYGYIPKPFTPDELLLPVRKGLEHRALTIEARRLREERESQLLELAYERSKSSTIINCMTDGVLVVNRDRQVVLRNAAAARMLADCEVTPLPTPMSAIECPELRAVVDEVLGGEGGPVIVSREIALGKCTYMVNASPVAEAGGAPVGAVTVLRDITAIKKLETAKSVFVSMVAHEVKGPLAAIEGYINLILSGTGGNDPERDRHMLERCLMRATTLRTMVSELMSLTAIQTGNFHLKRAPLDLGGAVEEAVSSCAEAAAAKKMDLAIEGGAAPRGIEVLADRDAVGSIVRNLVTNAVKYTPDGGHVRVRLDSDGFYARVSVKDDGIGIEPEDKARIFDEFFRAKNDYTSQVPGTGLGLTIVKRLVEMHQGRIAVDSTPGKGSIFTVSLPRTGGDRGESP